MTHVQEPVTPGKPIRIYASSGQWRDVSTDELVGQGLNRFKSWTCYAGVDNLFIDMDGVAWVASCRQGGSLGNVFESMTSLNSTLTCEQDVCSCGADLFIPKHASSTEKTLLGRTHGAPTVWENKLEALDAFVATERTHASTRPQVYWELGRRCNYDCSYCWPWIHNNTDAHKTFEELLAATDNLEKSFLKGRAANFIISGGEPTANSAFLDWMRYLSNVFGHHVSVHSNGSRRPLYYRELIKNGDLNLSLHFEFYERQRFLDVVRACTEEKVTASSRRGHLEVKLMAAPHNEAEALVVAEDMKAIPGFNEYCTYAFVPIRGGLDNNKAVPKTTSGSEVMPGYSPIFLTKFGVGK